MNAIPTLSLRAQRGNLSSIRNPKSAIRNRGVPPSLVPRYGVPQRVLAERVRPISVDAAGQRHEQRVYVGCRFIAPRGQAVKKLDELSLRLRSGVGRNPKFEYRTSKQIRITKARNSKRAKLARVFLSLGFRI